MYYYKDMDGGVGAMDSLDAQFDAPIEIITKEEFDAIIAAYEVVGQSTLAEEYIPPEDTLI